MKKQKVEERHAPPISVSGGNPPEISEEAMAEALEKLEEVQEALDKLNEQANDEVLKVEQKYNRERKPVFEKRSKLIANIPEFWMTVFMSHGDMFTTLTEDDYNVLEFLREVNVEDFPDISSGHTISMIFAENPYFEDTELKKTYKFSDTGTVKISGTKIRWKPGKDITKKKAANGEESQKEGKKRELQDLQDSFFKWFDIPEAEHGVDDVTDEIADLIREELWPNPLKFFRNEGEEGPEGEEGGEEEEGEEGDEEGNDDDDDENGLEGEDGEEG